MVSSSTLTELLAVKFVLLSMLNHLSGLTVQLFTDNQNVTNIVSCGSAKAHLQAAALRYTGCPKKRNISTLVIYSIQNDKEFVKNT